MPPSPIPAEAQPEKRLFISLLTRDISLIDAILDLMDNSINSALTSHARRLESAADYRALFTDQTVTPHAKIQITVQPDSIVISDTAAGISCQTAEHHVFRFGRPARTENGDDRLSVYGIGLKRAIFKIGDHIDIRSEHTAGGFDLDLDVPKWEAELQEKWTIPITPRPPVPAGSTGTDIRISRLHDDVTRRISDAKFLSELADRISQTYSFFIERIVDITVNGSQVERILQEIDENFSTDFFLTDGVSCSISCGIPRAKEGFSYRNAGWFVFCNGRALLYGDKGPLTGWGVPGYLPIFQAKHNPFFGVVFFVATDPESLPWTTTKASVNQESLVWQEAKRRMASVARSLITFLDRRYADDSAQLTHEDLAAGSGNRVNALDAVSGPRRTFQVPPRPPASDTSIQYRVQIIDVDKICTHLGRRGMSNSEVGRYTFNYYLKNEASE